MSNKDWQVDEFGRRYREIAKGCIEYETMVTVSGGIEIPLSELSAYNRLQKQTAEECYRKAAEEMAKRPKTVSCPFANGADTTCKLEKCTLFFKDKCSIAVIADSTNITFNEQKTKSGAKCPFSSYAHCKTCALDNGGCAIVRLAAATNKIEK